MINHTAYSFFIHSLNKYLLSPYYVPGAALSTTNLTIGPVNFSFGKFKSCHDPTADVSSHHFMRYLKLNQLVFYRANSWNFIHILVDQV